MAVKLTPAQAHMLAMTRLLASINHNSGFKGGVRTARALAAKGLLTLTEHPDDGTWKAHIPLRTLIQERGVRWLGVDHAFVVVGGEGTVHRPVYYAVRTWHDGHRYIYAAHPDIAEKEHVRLDELEIGPSHTELHIELATAALAAKYAQEG